MRKIAVIMNTNEVGGAERSLVFQMKNQSDGEITFFIPKITKSIKLETFLKESGFNNIQYYFYPKSFYSLSRKNLSFRPSMLKDVFSLFFKSGTYTDFKKFDLAYLNGNKAAFLFLLKNKSLGFKGKVVWHLRDYYHSGPITDIVWKFLNTFGQDKLSFICNSNSVKQSLLSSHWKNYPIEVIYNPVGESFALRDTTKTIKTIGFVSMLTPWKGVHEIILWSKLYEKELEALGITQVNIYGENIYRTHGDHNDYQEQLKKLCQKFDSKLLNFKGHKDPKEIFQEIDCLIHYSLSPEPFGRVILEAFDAGIPVVSTCLGGAAELVDGYEAGVKVYAHDRQGLYVAVEQLVLNREKTFKLITGGLKKSKFIQENIANNMKKILQVGATT